MVQERLRELDSPICLFGEDARDRRDRLRRLLVSLGLHNGVPTQDTLGWSTEQPDKSSLPDDLETSELPAEYFTRGANPSLRAVRRTLAEYSLPRAQLRLQRLRQRHLAIQREISDTQEAVKELSLSPTPDDPAVQQRFNARVSSIDGPLSRRKRFLQRLQQLSLSSSQVGDGRPLGCCAISNDRSTLAVGSWSGNCLLFQTESSSINDNMNHSSSSSSSFTNSTLLNTTDSNLSTTNNTTGDLKPTVLVGHRGRLIDVAWQFADGYDGAEASSHRAVMVSCDIHGDILMWQPSQSASPLRFPQPHTARANRLAFHPWQRHFGSTSHDMTWRLWDVERQAEVSQQGGHEKAPFALAFHPDGSLACTGGEDAVVRLWDLRSGKSVAHFQEHSQAVYCAAFHPDGVQLASGGGDNFVRVMDLRQTRCQYVVPAHNSSVTRLAYERHGHCLVSSGYDQKVRLWSVNDYAQIVSLSGHAGMIMGMSVAAHADPAVMPSIYTASFDKTWKQYKI